jgi:hypothetical protein
MWVEIASIFNHIIEVLIQNKLAALILGAVGLSGGFWLFFVKLGLGKIWGKIKPEIESGARLEDQKKVDKELNDQYQKDIKGGADEKTLIKDELDILNGGHK